MAPGLFYSFFCLPYVWVLFVVSFLFWTEYFILEWITNSHMHMLYYLVLLLDLRLKLSFAKISCQDAERQCLFTVLPMVHGAECSSLKLRDFLAKLLS